MKKVLLYSGGMDSWLIDKLWKPDVRLFFAIGTPNSDAELRRVVKRKDVEIASLDLAQFEQPENNYFLPLRNLHFVVYAAHYGDIICLGATGSSTHRDKNDVFATLAENSINYLLGEGADKRDVQIVMPFRNMSKTEILAQYLKEGGDIQECYKNTFSCYNPGSDGKPCMKCSSCLSKFTAFYENGYPFTEDEVEQFIEGVFANSNSKGDAFDLAMRLKYGNKTLCIDFDKTITDDSPYPITGNLRPGVLEYLKQYKEQGYRLILFTSRKGHDFDEAVALCKEWKLPLDDYLAGKPFARYYIDDKAIKTFEEVV